MTRLTVLKGLLWLSAVWHLAHGLVSTFAPEAGAQAVGWTAEGGWDAELIAMSSQYGMSMMVLAVMFVVMALNPLRHLDLIWVPIAERVFGILYAIYYVLVGHLTIPQIPTQSAINAAVIIIFLILWQGLKKDVPEGLGQY